MDLAPIDFPLFPFNPLRPELDLEEAKKQTYNVERARVKGGLYTAEEEKINTAD